MQKVLSIFLNWITLNIPPTGIFTLKEAVKFYLNLIICVDALYIYCQKCVRIPLKGLKNCGDLWFHNTGDLLTQVNCSKNCTF